MNNNSTDGSKNIIEEYRNKDVKIINQIKVGVGNSIQDGL